ncbi:Uncharacterised protein [Mycobacteroides abscessus]|nr:Uncharacterised protein [Mycobacteroides abscessus]CPZ82976.1 Uncharacterised protein [Mycobacteroides abscessus]SKT71019.1 Uncharacterised protein [Mycobacteroides abscessus subsp. abscessus]
MTGPRVSIAREANSPPSCDPDTKTIRRDDKSGFTDNSSRALSRRLSITGTTTIAVTLNFSTSASTFSGLNFRRRIRVHPSVSARLWCR